MPIIYILSPGLTELTKSPWRTTFTDWGSKPGGADYGSYWTTICCIFLNELRPY